MYLVMLSFITNPMLTAASLICVTAYSFAHTNHPSINTLSVFVVYRLVQLKIAPFSVVFVLGSGNEDVKTNIVVLLLHAA
jgi:hypothetical protein